MKQQNSLRRSCLLFFQAAGLILFCLNTVSFAGPTVTDNVIGFTLTVPEGFKQYGASGKAMYLFATSDPAEGMPDYIVMVQRLDGTIGQDRLSPSKSIEKVTTADWQGHTVDVAQTHMGVSDVSLAFRTVQIPLKKEAIQLVMSARAENESHLDEVLAGWLGGISGESNWPAPLTQSQRDTALGRVVADVGMAALAATGVMVYILLRWRREGRAKRPIPDGKKNRHTQAMLVGWFAAASVILALIIAGAIGVGIGRGLNPQHDDFGPRATQALLGSLQFAIFMWAVVYSITRGIRRLRSGPVMPAKPAAAAASPTAYDIPRDADFVIVDDT